MPNKPIASRPPVQPHPSRPGGAGAPVAAAAAPPAADTFRCETACDKCGGPVFFGEEDRTTTCAYCGSLLVLELDGREPCYYLPTRLGDAATLRAVLAFNLAMRQRPSIVERLVPDPTADVSLIPAAIIDDEVRRLERQYLGSLRLNSVTCVYVPYRLVSAELGQAFVGRYDHGGKDVSFRIYSLECTLRGYPASLANLRDQGLKLEIGRLRLLTSKVVASLAAKFLRADRAEAQVARFEELRHRPQDPSLAPIVAPRGELLFTRQSRVYKPYLYVDLTNVGQTEAILVDGSTEQLAGSLGIAERQALLESEAAFEVPVLAPTDAVVHRFASRCPVCGHDQAVDHRAHIQLCRVCNRGLGFEPRGIVVCDYRYARPPSAGAGAWTPFWRFRFGLQGRDGRRIDSLAALHETIYRGLPAPSSAGSHLTVPALRVTGHERLDRLFAQLAWGATYEPPVELQTGPLDPDTPGRRLPVTLTVDEARALAPLVLYTLLDTPRRARANMPTVRNLLAESTLELTDPELLFLPLPLVAGRLEVGGDPIELALLERDGAEFNLRQRLRWSI